MGVFQRRVVVPGQELPQPWDERLPNGRSVDEAMQGQSPDRMSGVASSPSRILAPPPNTDAQPIERDPYAGARNPSIRTLAEVGPPPTMIQNNNKGRPVAIIGGDDRVANNMELIRAQEDYKAPRSTKDQILSFLQGGVSGAIDYATNQNTRNRWATGEDIAKEQGQIQRQVSLDKSRNDLLNDKARRQLEGARAIKALKEPIPREPGFTLGEGQTRYDAQGNVLQAGPPKAKSTKPPIRQADEQGNEYYADAESGEPLRDSKGEIRYAARAKPPKPDETPKDFASRSRNFTAAQSEYQGLIEEEKAAALAKDKAYANYSTIKDQWVRAGNPNPDIQSDVVAAKKAADEAQTHYASFWSKKDAAKAKMLRHGDGVDANGEPLPPKPLTRGARSGAPSPSTHVLNKQAWLKSHPETDWPKAIVAAKAAGYQVIQ